MTARVRQSVAAQSSGSTTQTLTFPRAVLPGNTVIVVSDPDGDLHSGAITLGAGNMAVDLSTNFGLRRHASIVATGGETVVTVTLAGTGNWRGVAIEVPGLVTAVAVDDTVENTATGEGSSTSHSCEYANAGNRRFGVAYVDTFNPDTITGANGATFYGNATRFGLVVKGDLGTGAGSIDFTLSNARSLNYSLVTYQELNRPFVIDVEAITWAAGQNPASQNITPPVGCNVVLTTHTYYANSAGSGLAATTLDSDAPDLSGELVIATPDQPAAIYALWYNPPTGSAIALDVDWDVAPTEGPTTFVTYLADVDTGVGVVDVDYAHVNGGTQQTVTLTTVTGKLALAHDQKYLTPEPSNESGWTSLATMVNTFEAARMRYIVPSGTTQSVSTQDTNYSSLIALSFDGPSSGGGGPTYIKPFITPVTQMIADQSVLAGTGTVT